MANSIEISIHIELAVYVCMYIWPYRPMFVWKWPILCDKDVPRLAIQYPIRFSQKSSAYRELCSCAPALLSFRFLVVSSKWLISTSSIALAFNNFILYQCRRNDKSTTEVNRKIVIADARKDYMKKCVSDDEQESDDSWPLSGEREHKRSNSNGLATVTTLTRRNENRFEKNFGRKDNVTTDIELMPLNAPRRSSSQKQNNQTATGRTLVGKSTSRKKSIPIVNNLHNQSEDDDGTEVWRHKHNGCDVI